MAKTVKPSPQNQLPESLRNDYEIVGEWPDKFEVTGLEVAHIDWKNMTPAFADHLIAEGFKGIRKKDAPAI